LYLYRQIHKYILFVTYIPNLRLAGSYENAFYDKQLLNFINL